MVDIINYNTNTAYIQKHIHSTSFFVIYSFWRQQIFYVLKWLAARWSLRYVGLCLCFNSKSCHYGFRTCGKFINWSQHRINFTRILFLLVIFFIMMNFQDSGSLTATGLSRNICADTADTVQRTLGAYVDIFLYVSEDCHNRTFERDTVISFVDALRGLASISHILLEDALEALSHTHPKESLSEYAFNSDVKSIYRDFNCQMDDHVDGFWNPKTNPVEVRCVRGYAYMCNLPFVSFADVRIWFCSWCSRRFINA